MDASNIAPWIATVLGIGAAVAAERAFVHSSAGSTPDRWHGADIFYDGLGIEQESDERMARDCAREAAAAWQIGATYLAAGAAVEAAAASQHDVVALALTIFGVLSLAPIVVRYVRAREQREWLRAWYLRGKWDSARKWIHSQDYDEEDALFAREHPREAAALKRRPVDRTPPYE